MTQTPSTLLHASKAVDYPKAEERSPSLDKDRDVHQTSGRSELTATSSTTRPRAFKRVLALGHCSSTFVTPLYRALGQALPGLQVDVLGFVSAADKVTDQERAVFRRFHESPPAALEWELLAGLIRAAIQPSLWWRLWCRAVAGNILERDSLRELVCSARMANIKARQQYDLYHLHFCTAETLRFIDAVPNGAKLICSFWGSDLLRTHGTYEYLHQSRALERADVITVQSPEMRETLLAKFGRHLFPKVRRLYYLLNEKLYHFIDDLLREREGIEIFRRGLKIPRGRLLVTVGHNGNPANNQLAIIDTLSGLSPSEKEAVVWVFPMKYLDDDSYPAAVREAAMAAGLDFRLLTNYLDLPELAAFRVSTDILIHLPVSDALSATVLETIYSGNCVITGAWLPYGPFRKAQLRLVTVDNLRELPICISNTLVRLAELKREAVEARPRIRGHFLAEATVPGWVELYRHLLGPARAANLK